MTDDRHVKALPEKKAYPFLQGGGEMGELIHAYDWSKTAVGAMDAWPVSLRTAMGLMLTSRFPMLLFWGKELITFYNDAFRPSLGNDGKHPSSLGQRGEVSWAESWPTIGPLIYGIMAGGDAVWFEDQKLPIYRHGKMDYAYWTYSFSPVRNDENEIGGLLVTCAETTKAVENLQRLSDANEELKQTLEYNGALQKGLEESRQQLLGLFEQSPVAIAILGKDRLTIKMANAFYCELIDKRHDDIIGKPLLDVLPEMAGQGFDGLMNNVITTGTPFTASEIPAQLVRGGRLETFYINLTYNPVREPDGSISGVFIVATDITQQVNARQKSEEIAKKLNTLIQSAPVAIGLFIGRDLIIETPNETFVEIIGRGPDIAGKSLRAVMPELESQPFLQILDNVFNSGETFRMYGAKLLVQREDKLWERYFDVTFSPIFNEQGAVVSILDISIDVTEQVAARKKLEESESRFRSLIEEAPVATCLFVGPEMKVEVINAMMVAAWGKDFSVLNKPLIEALPELKGQPFMDLLANVYNTGEAYKGVAAPVDLVVDGRLDTYYYDFTYKPLLTEERKVWAIINVSINVTDRVLATKRIEESEARFRALIEEAPFPTALYEGEEVTIAIANEEMIKLWGKTPAIVGMPLLQALPELEGQPFLPLLKEVFRTGQTYQTKEQSAELVVDGKPQRFWFNFTYKPLFDAAGKVYAILNMAVDISRQVLARQQLQESELFARSIIDNSPVAKIVFVGEGMTVSTVNQNMLAMLGRDESIIGQGFMEAIPELIPTPLMDRLRHVYATGDTYVQPEEKIVLIKDGRPYTGYYQYIYKALRNTAGEIYGIITTATEITGQVEARKKIEEAEAILSAAIELAELATWEINFITGAATSSLRMRSWLGLHESEPEPNGSLIGIHPRDQARIRTAIEKAKGWGEGHFDETYTIVNQQSGQERIIHANGRTVFDAAGKAVSLSGTAQDVTIQRELQLALENEVQVRTEELAAAAEELRATNEELAETNSQLLRSNEELAQYAYVASHDLQEPLRKIRLFSSRLDPRKQSADDMQMAIEKIQSSTDRMSLLIKDLLDFSRLLKSDSLLRPVDLTGVVNDVIGDFELTISEKEARMVVGELPVIEGVSLQFNQLFYNLVGNALKFTKEGRKPVVQITSRLATDQEVGEHIEKAIEGVRYYLIAVSDNGIGFEPLYMEQIFEVFKRLHGRTEYAGSGIGLAVCRRIVQNHQGKIYAEAEPDEGASFQILLPEAQAAHQSSLPDDFIWKQ